uniref:Uncharacterized protein n=1 Tax=Grammatophora oceanica TaxID=210454 RepID=A0A7S1UM96_9STRA|mmetsp:Transcript_12080/g.17709  ORF Transcript_12080/g.17709 Transcript_12080/m.17709 type:complete len:230 (+) Transcript_12080:79-768(+)
MTRRSSTAAVLALLCTTTNVLLVDANNYVRRQPPSSGGRPLVVPNVITDLDSMRTDLTKEQVAAMRANSNANKVNRPFAGHTSNLEDLVGQATPLLLVGDAETKGRNQLSSKSGLVADPIDDYTQHAKHATTKKQNVNSDNDKDEHEVLEKKVVDPLDSEDRKHHDKHQKAKQLRSAAKASAESKEEQNKNSKDGPVVEIEFGRKFEVHQWPGIPDEDAVDDVVHEALA